MDLNLGGKVAVVTGGSIGIGRAIAAELSREQAHVVIVARDAERLKTAAQEISRDTGRRVIACAGDMTRPDDIARAMETAREAFGRIDILVNNAGASPMGRIAETPDAIWAKSIELKLLGYMRCARNVLPEMRDRRWGRVINIIGRSGHQPRADARLTAWRTATSTISPRRGCARRFRTRRSPRTCANSRCRCARRSPRASRPGCPSSTSPR